MFMEQITTAMDFVYNSVKEARMAQQAYIELSRLNDRELADLGINRLDIVRVAYKLDR
jgi:uncharacterized protein YjiS (DUF1127 family)